MSIAVHRIFVIYTTSMGVDRIDEKSEKTVFLQHLKIPL